MTSKFLINIKIMKNILYVFLLALLVVSCKNENKEEVSVEEEVTTEVTYVPFGDKIEADNALSAQDMAAKYGAMKVGDSISTKMTAKVNSVCQVKGCWMRLDLGNDEEVMVKFKDYAFFMPKNISGKDVIIDGNAYVNEISVEDLKHYAEDAGKTEEEIAAITEPRKTYTFMADGVLLVEE